MAKAGTYISSAIALAVAVALASCSSEEKYVPNALKWSKLSDGSWLSNSIAAPTSSEVTRCWPLQVGFDCLNAFVGGGSIMLSRASSRDLPMQWPANTNGYSCGYSKQTELLDETIEGTVANGATASLKTHSVKPAIERNAVWARGEVNGYMTSNHISGSQHFDCAFVVQLISKGSYLSIGTTDLSYRQFLGLDNPENPIILRDANDPLSFIDPAPER